MIAFFNWDPWDLRVPPVAFKGSTESNQETGTKRHLRPLDAFPELLVHPKCIGSRLGGAYSIPRIP